MKQTVSVLLDLSPFALSRSTHAMKKKIHSHHQTIPPQRDRKGDSGARENFVLFFVVVVVVVALYDTGSPDVTSRFQKTEITV